MSHQNQGRVFMMNLSWLKWSLKLQWVFIVKLLQIFKGRFLKMRISSYLGRNISTSVALTYTKPYSFIHIYILKVFTEGFVEISFIA